MSLEPIFLTSSEVKVFSWLAFLLSLFWFQASSQILVGPIAGANYSWTTFANKDLKDSYKMIPTLGFHVGGQLAFKVRNRFFCPYVTIVCNKGVGRLRGKTDVLLKASERGTGTQKRKEYDRQKET